LLLSLADVVREVLDFDPRDPIDSFWWKHIDYSDNDDDDMDTDENSAEDLDDEADDEEE
jgi:hypothetical protein